MKYSNVIRQHVERMRSNYANTPFEGELNRLQKGVEALEHLAVNRDPTVTDEAHTAKLSRSAKRLLNETEGSRSRVTRTLGERLERLNNSIKEQAKLYPHPTYAAEIRQALRSMKHTERIDVLNKALKDGDGQTIATIYDAPELLTGIKPEIAAQYADALEKQAAEDLYTEREALNESAANKGFDPVKLREIEQAEKRHAEAQTGFEQAFNDPA